MTGRRLTWRNHSRDQECHPRRIVHPSETAELQAIVRDAEGDGTTVRAVGAGHAWSDVALTDGVLVETDRMTGVVEQVGEDLVRVRGGTRIRDLNAALDARGLGLVNMGGYDGQAIAGVVATSTHGSGLAFGPFPDYVESIDLVASEGRLVHLQRGDDDFDAAVCAMGCMGIVDSLVLRVRPRFWLHEQRVGRTWRDVRAELDALLAREEHFELFLDPYSTDVLQTTRTEVPEPTHGSPGDGERHPLIEIQASIPLVWIVLRLAARWAPSLLRTQFPRTLRRMEDPSYTQISHRVFNIGAANHLPALSSELGVPVEGDAHLRAVDRIIELAGELARTRKLFHTSPLSLRFVAPSSALASMMHGRPTMMIELILVAETRGGRELLAEYERRLGAEFGARPHWGQYNELGPRAGALYPRWDDWLAVYERMNATGVFDSEFTDRIGISRRPG
jgi:L-gulono-1,4-lactone dehydrogenase